MKNTPRGGEQKEEHPAKTLTFSGARDTVKVKTNHHAPTGRKNHERKTQ